MFLNSLENQLNLLFEILKTIFLNLNVTSFQVTLGGIKNLWGWNKNLIGKDSDGGGGGGGRGRGGLILDRKGFGQFLTDEGE